MAEIEIRCEKDTYFPTAGPIALEVTWYARMAYLVGGVSRIEWEWSSRTGVWKHAWTRGGRWAIPLGHPWLR